MRVFLAGAGGAIGRHLIPRLIAEGHEVVAMTRSPKKVDALRDAGAYPVVADGLDRDAVIAAVTGAEPEVVVHQMTALTDLSGNLRRFDQEFAVTNELRTKGTDNLLAGALAAGARRIIVQSFAGWPTIRDGGPVKTEDDPFDPHPPAAMRASQEAMRYLERTVVGAEGIEGIVLRYGGFYGAPADMPPTMLEVVRKRRFPVVGDGAGVWSFVHLDDAADATVAALDHGTPGVYNIVDDDPAPVAEWLPGMAAALGAKPPRRVPAWLGRLLAGEAGISMMTKVRGSSNAKAKRELQWEPRHPSWREGFREALTA
ncbi:MAG TPA: NAD(P)-dependent oxidoreductase [Solirubrobacteraceae bacterium]|jgi:nucleoside-diphosphate-sugar epimerase